ncbi:MAG: hypothetical protein JRI42_00475 [Deltaproteobacteria bacterium]|nr:hypothetical protein [Deltaproteobacteria bacterium]
MCIEKNMGTSFFIDALSKMHQRDPDNCDVPGGAHSAQADKATVHYIPIIGIQ